MKPTLQDIRDNIDKVDFEILSLLKDRKELVLSAVQFKGCKEGGTGVIVPSRIKSMLADRVVEAERLGLDEEFIETLCRMVIDHMIKIEMKRWKDSDSSS